MLKLALLLIMGSAFAQGLSASQPPLLIQDTTAPLDGGR
jgi:hypothetical protein